MRLHHLDKAGRVINLKCCGEHSAHSGWVFIPETKEISSLKVGDKIPYDGGFLMRVPDDHTTHEVYIHHVPVVSDKKVK